MAWLFANHNYVEFFEDIIDNDFAHYKDFRHFIYEFAPELPEHGYVRVTYKKDLLPHPAGSNLPEFQPYILENGW